MSVLKIHTGATELAKNDQLEEPTWQGTNLKEGFLKGHKILKEVGFGVKRGKVEMNH